MDIINEVSGIIDEIKEVRRRLHKSPELGLDLPKTKKIVRDYLAKIGCLPKECGKGGLTLEIGENKGECVLIRADMDGLEITEDNSLCFKSEIGRMHACGHDMHTAMLLGACKILKKWEKALPVCVKVMLQGGEELLVGAEEMIKNGVMEKPRVVAGGMVHVLTGTKAKTGTIFLGKAGSTSPYANFFKIEVRGKGTHGAMTSQGKDPINALCHIILALQAITTRELPFVDSASISIGMVRGGKSPNAIPETATLEGSVRSMSKENQEYAVSRIKEIATLVSHAFNTEATVILNGSAPPLKNDEFLLKRSEECLKKLFGKQMVISYGNMSDDGVSKNTGSEDFANVTQLVPSVMVGISAGLGSFDRECPLHSPQVIFDEDALFHGTCTYLSLATEILPRVVLRHIDNAENDAISLFQNEMKEF